MAPGKVHRTPVLIANETLADLRARFPHPGTVTWIGVRPKPRAAVYPLSTVRLRAGLGVEGDHRARRGGGRRQVTLIQDEHLAVIAALVGHQRLDPARLRRNVVVRGVNVAALKGVRFRLGEALLEGTGPCHPCSRMEQVLGPGGYNAVRGHGGLTAVVLEDGQVSVGDRLVVIGEAS